MIMKKLYKDGNKQVYLLSNKNGYKKGKLSVKHNLNMGEVIEVEDSIEGTIDISDFEYVKDFNLEDYLPSVKRPINDIMFDIEEITNECIISEEGKILNDYFFNDEKFLEEFQKVIDNINDPNTETKPVRKVVLTLSFKANSNRNHAIVSVTADSKLAKAEAIETDIIIDEDTRSGQVLAAEYDNQIAGQEKMDIPEEEAKPGKDETVIDFRKRKKLNNNFGR